MTTIMVKSIQFGKIVKQVGQNKRAGRKYFSDLLNEQAENLRAGSSIRDFRLIVGGCGICIFYIK